MLKKLFSEAQQSSNNDTWEDQYDKVVAYLNKVKAEMSDLMKSCGQLEYELEEERKKGEAQTRKLLLELIEIADAFEGIFKYIEPDLRNESAQVQSWVESFQTVYLMMQRVLNNQKVIPYETSVGEKANPYRHKVVDVVSMREWHDQTIVEVLRKGYRWKENPLRYAHVVAVKNT